MKNLKQLFIWCLLMHSAHALEQFNSVLLIINYNHAYYQSIPFLETIYKSYFKNIVFYGPEKHEGVHELKHNKGYLSYLCIADAMERYPNYEGYLFVHDDCILNAWKFKGLDTEQLWMPRWKVRYSDVGEAIDLALGDQAFVKWPWWKSQWGCVPMTNAFNELSESNKAMLALNWGPNHVVATYADIVYIPHRYKEQYIELAHHFAKHNAFLELALPTIISCLDTKANWVWLPGKSLCSLKHYRGDVYFNHPIKLSKQENRDFVTMLYASRAD